MVRQTAKVVALELVGGLILVATLGAFALAVRLASGPLELRQFKDDIERALTGARDGRDVTVERVALEWATERRRLLVTADGLVFKDDAGRPAAEAQRAEITLDAGALLLGRVRPVELALSDGWLRAVQDEAGWSIAGEPAGRRSGGPAPERRLPNNAEALFALANNALTDLIGDLKVLAEAIEIEALSVTRFDLSAEGADGVELLRLDNADGLFASDEDGLRLRFSGRSDPARGLPAGFAVDFSAPTDFSSLEAEFGFAGWSLEALSARFSNIADVAAGVPTDFALSFEVAADMGIEAVGLTIEAGAGELRLAENAIPVGGVDLKLHYAAADDSIMIDVARLDAAVVDAQLTFELDDALRGEGPRPYRFASESLNLDFTPVFDDVLRLERVASAGDINLQSGEVRFDSLDIDDDAARIGSAGVFQWHGGGSRTQLPLSLSIEASVTGPMPFAQVLSYWPAGLADGAREFAAKDVWDGVLDRVEIAADLKPESLASGGLADEALTLDFEMRDGIVKVLRDIPPITGASGVGHLTGNGMVLNVASARLSEWTIERGEVVFPQFRPNGGWIHVTGQARGPVVDLMTMASESRLQIEARSGFSPTRLSGTAEIDLQLTRPPLRMMDKMPITFTATGQAKNTGVTDVIAGFDVANATADIDLTETGIQVSGFGDFGPSPIRFVWRDGFDDGDPSSSVEADAVLNTDLLNRFGMLGRAYLTGEIPVHVTARAAGEALEAGDFDLDLQEARIDVAEIGWVKPAGAPATARVRYTQNASGPMASVVVSASDLEFDGDVVLGPSGRVESANLRRAFLAGRADLGGSIRRSLEGGLIARLSGPFLDVSDAMGGVAGFAGGGGDVSTFSGDYVLEAELDALRLREDLDMTEATLSVESSEEEGVQTIVATGLTDDRTPFEASYTTAQDGEATFSVSSGDASFLAEAVFGLDFLRGGRMQLDGVLPAGGGATELRLLINDTRLVNAPFLTQILTLGSLRGLADTLAGEGVLFTQIDVPLKISGGRYIVEGAAASGPGLGLTANGWVDGEEGGVELRGVVVPSFGVNSALGGIPLIGDLFVSREGEGVFSLTYQVDGTLERARVAVNPLSAVTPGFLRRIFEDPADVEFPDPEEVTPGE
ncbi:MAG: DUF3971 domain-containing protein [Pseudomonadota bacterium]